MVVNKKNIESSQFLEAANLNILWARLFIEECVRQGVKGFFIGPGSRSSLLVQAVAERRNVFSVVHPDERGLGFHALGYASGCGGPVVVIVTSGTAVANLLPSIIEASKKKLPVLIVSADRPVELQQTGAHQTIDYQSEIFSSFVRYKTQLPAPTDIIPPEFILTTVGQLLSRTRGEYAGAVHVNWSFRKPLSLEPRSWSKAYLIPIKFWLKSAKPYTQWSLAERILSEESSLKLADKINAMKKGLIVVGKLNNAQEARHVLDLAEKTGFPVLPDVTSGLRLGMKHSLVMSYFDQALKNRASWVHLFCDGIIHLGGRIVSDRYYSFVQHIKPQEYISVLAHPLRSDPLNCVTQRVVTTPNMFCSLVLPYLAHKCGSQYANIWAKENVKAEKNIIKSVSLRSLTEASLARYISKKIPSQDALFLGNSMPIRFMSLCAETSGPDVVVASHKGASGIDGLVASTLGYASGCDRNATLIVGDVSFFHDLNSLALARQCSKRVVIVLVNNNGGHIFVNLPMAKAATQFNRFFVTPQKVNYTALAGAFDGVSACQVASMTTLAHALKEAWSAPKGVHLIEVSILRNKKRKGSVCSYF